jgi:hypothetical protein
MTNAVRPAPRRYIHRDSRLTGAEKRRRWLTVLLGAQDGLCAICGKPIEVAKNNGPSIDHVFPKSQANTAARCRPPGLGHWQRPRPNLLLASHRKCNSRKCDRYPTGCEMIWLYWVNARLGAERPSSAFVPLRQREAA